MIIVKEANMNARFVKYAVMLLVTFVAGALYGAFWDRCVANDVKVTGPATREDLAQFRAGIARPAQPPAIIKTGTNTRPVMPR